MLMQMGRERAAEVLRLLSPQDAEELAAQVARLSTVDDEIAQAALVEFATRATAPTRPHGGREAAEKLLEATFGAERAQQVLGRMTPDRPFEFLDAADPAVIRPCSPTSCPRRSRSSSSTSPPRRRRVCSGVWTPSRASPSRRRSRAAAPRARMP